MVVHRTSHSWATLVYHIMVFFRPTFWTNWEVWGWSVCVHWALLSRSLKLMVWSHSHPCQGNRFNEMKFTLNLISTVYCEEMNFSVEVNKWRLLYSICVRVTASLQYSTVLQTRASTKIPDCQDELATVLPVCSEELIRKFEPKCTRLLQVGTFDIFILIVLPNTLILFAYLDISIP